MVSQCASYCKSIEHAATDLTNSKSPRSTTVRNGFGEGNVASVQKESFLCTFDPISRTQAFDAIDSAASSNVSHLAFHDDVIVAAKLASEPSRKGAYIV